MRPWAAEQISDIEGERKNLKAVDRLADS